MKSRRLWPVLAGSSLAVSLGAAPLSPVFPREFAPLIYTEAEDAVATTFTQQATLDYGSSGYRVLQLNKGPDAPGAPFFAEYVLSVDEAGNYELWLGGTPVGSRSALSPSYASPLTVTIDDGTPFSLYREDVNVVAQYSLVNYWSKAKVLVPLTKGPHVVRFTVAERRRYDNRSYFSFDAFFFLKDGVNPPAEVVPERFPTDRANRSIDNYYLTVDQYDYLLQTKPQELSNYLELAKVYSLVGDYQNALKTLDRARVDVGDSPAVTLMMAKNRVWSGDWSEGLDLYQSYLKTTPNDLATWSELAKVLAWQGQYTSSLEAYRLALGHFPADLNLSVNYGLTYLWANRIQEGEAQLGRTWSLVQNDPDQIASLGEIYAANGYPDKAAETYERGVSLYPNQLNLYLKLEQSWLGQAQKAKADEVARRIVETFEPSDRLTAVEAALERKASLKDAVLASYEAKLKANPDDVKLREQLVQAYYWNGAKEKAVAETRHILVNRLYTQFVTLDQELEPTYRVLDLLAVARRRLADLAPQAAPLAQKVSQALARWASASTSKTHEGLPASEEALVLVTQEVEDYLALVHKVEALASGLPDQAAPEVAKVEGDQKVLDGYRPWTWNREAAFAELNLVSRDGLSLADGLLGRLDLNEQNLAAARLPLGKLSSAEEVPARLRALVLQGPLWTTGRGDPEALNAGPYFGHGAELAQTLNDLETSSAEPGAFDPETPRRAAELAQGLESLARSLDATNKKLEGVQTQLHHRLMVRTKVQFYRFDLETLELRYQLGSYLLDLNRHDEARVELGRALVMSPQNVSIQFDLGRARQLSGDWSGAMELYRSIYQTNPKFEFTASSYNQLARLHADSFSTQVTSFVDNARDTTQAVLNYHLAGTSLLSFDASYTLDNLRLYQQSATLVPGSIHLQTVVARPRLTLGFLNLSLYGQVGGVFQDTLLNASVPSTASVEPTDPLTKYLGVSPVVGAGASWAWGPATWTGSYTYDQVKDTFLLGRTSTQAGTAESTLSLYFPLPASWWVHAVGTRTYAKEAELYQGSGVTNHVFAALQEFSGVFSLAAQPVTNLTLVSLVSWDNSTNPGEASYYSPNQVLVWKNSGQVDTSLPVGGGWNLGLVGRLGAGVYADSTGQNLLTDGGLSVRATTGDLVIEGGVTALRAANGSDVAYWSGQGQITVTVGLPSYIIR